MSVSTGSSIDLAVDCLIPTGLLISVPVSSRRWTLMELKSELWKKAERLPLFGELKKQESYGLHTVDKTGEIVELADESQYVVKVDWYQPLIKLFLRKGDKSSQKFDMEVGHLINFHLPVFDNMRDADKEVASFRRNILAVCQEEIKRRQKGGAKADFLYMYPEDVVDSLTLPKHLADKLDSKKTVFLKVFFGEESTSPGKTITASLDDSPAEVVKRALEKKGKGSANKGVDAYILQVEGRNDFLHPSYMLGQYRAIRRALAASKGSKQQGVLLNVVLQERDKLEILQGNHEMEKRLLGIPPIQEPQRKIQPLDLFFGLKTHDLEDQIFEVQVLQAFEVQFGKMFGIQVSAAIFQGEAQIGTTQKTRVVQPTDNPEWGERLKFDVKLRDLPRDSKLCICIHGVWISPVKMKKKKKKFKNEEPLAWVNISLFTFKGLLRSGTETLSTWAPPLDNDDLFLPHGTTMQNVDSSQRPSTLKINFGQYCQEGIKYPELDVLGNKHDGKVPTKNSPQTASDLQKVDRIVHKDPLYKLTEEDVALLRKYRYYVKDEPCALSKVLRAVDWTRQEAASEVVDILRHWTTISPEDAMDLLDCGFADSMTRTYAVNAMRQLTDSKLQQYLLQLVQVLKYEPYLDNALARFLLQRSLRNQRIGHFFFWYLRSEMHLAEAQLRYGLLLEAYCRGCGGHMPVLQRQIDCLDQLVKFAVSIKPKHFNKQQKLSMVRESLAQAKLPSFQLPYDPSVMLESVTCPRVMDSKKLPLWLTFKNQKTNTDVNIIFKAGDDLRQDMLTLQLISLMDSFWEDSGLDLKMNAYECLSTGDEVGMLEVVMNAKTIAGIQGRVGAVTNNEMLFNWLKENNPSEETLTAACDNFLLSCAGYCVATYVLGIGDRHNDNIMVQKTGQLFHIDFGHFLGNWKSKFGIRRERVKFILTPDFVYALCRGENRKESERWIQFKDVCKKAYLIVRSNANLFINLLNMMLSTGIPELQSHDDVAYLRNTLCLDMSDEDAGEAFMQEIDQALKDSWSVRVNWAAHIAAH